MGPPFAFKLPREGCESVLCSSTGPHALSKTSAAF